MTEIIKEVLIRASPNIVWTIIVQHLKYPHVELERGSEWNNLVIKDLKGEEVTEKRTGLGVQTRWYYKFYWFTFKWEDEVAEWDENKRIAWKSISTWEMNDSFTLIPENSQTRLISEMDYTPPYGILGRIGYRLFVNKHLEKNIEYTLARMKKNSERISRLQKPEK